MKKVFRIVVAVSLVVFFVAASQAADNNAGANEKFEVKPLPTTKYWKGDFSAYPKAKWHFKKQSRVVGAGEVSPEGRAVLESVRKTTGMNHDYNVFLTISRMDKIAIKYGEFLQALLFNNEFGLQDTERMVLRAAWRMGSIYEYSQHVKIAQKAGLTMDEIATLAKEDSPEWTGKIRAMMFAVDDLIASNDITDEHWKELNKYFDDDRMIELVFLIGHYEMVAQLINTIGIPVEDPFFISK